MRVVEGKPEFRIKVRNNGEMALTIHADHLAPTLLTKSGHHSCMDVPDGASRAPMTRHGLGLAPYGWGVAASHKFYWRITSGPVPSFAPLAPGFCVAAQPILGRDIRGMVRVVDVEEVKRFVGSL